jgi:hypothetical protein
MTAPFSIHADPSRNLVRIAMAGLFTLQDIEDFTEARRKAHAKLYCPPNAHVTLNDIRKLKIQPQEVVAAFRKMLAAPEYRSRRLAFVVGHTLALNQLMRALAGREGRFFEDPIAAEAWLLRDDAETAPLRRYAAG